MTTIGIGAPRHLPLRGRAARWRRRILPALVALVAWAPGARAQGATAGDTAAALPRAMAAFERPYVSALWATSNAPEAEARASLQRLASAWSAFRSGAGAAVAALPEGAGTLAMTDGLVAEAVRVGARDPRQAHDVLEGVRLRWAEFRARNRIVYFPDQLTAYHTPMEEIAIAGQAASAGGARGAAAVAGIRALYPAAVAAWGAVETTPHDNRVFGLAPERVAERERLLAAERAALQRLRLALAGDDAAEIGRAATALKPALARLVLLYGEGPLPPARR